jgi:1-acyl-sn-glycerol-3-phosphate acyltransferase
MEFEMKYDPKVVVRTAQRRVVSIPRIIRSDQVFRHANLTSQKVIGGLARVLVADVSFKGLENIERAKNMAKKSGLLVEGNHQSNSDTPVRRECFRRVGLEDFVNDTIVISGLQVAETSALFYPTEAVIQVVSPRDIEAAKWYRKNFDRLKANEAQREVVNKHLELARDLNKRATSHAFMFLDLDFPLFFYPEGGRSKDQQARMVRAHYGLSTYLTRDDDVLLPIYVDGSHKIMPPDRPLAKVARLEIGKGWVRGRQALEMEVGEPVYIGELREIASKVKRSKFTIADVAMYRLWRMRPNRIAPEAVPVYERIQDFLGEAA